MSDSENKNNIEDVEMTKRLERAFKRDRLRGWPSIIGISGTIAILVNIIFKGGDEYINIGSNSIYLWELGLYFLAISFVFLPASIKDAKCLASGKERPSTVSYIVGIALRLFIACVVIFVFFKFMYR